MNNARPHMLGISSVGFPSGATAGSSLGNINGLGAMGGMGNMGSMGALGNMGGMGGMGGMPGAAGQLQQQHPGSHAPPMGLLQNHQPQSHTNPPPMGGLQPGGSQPGQNQGVSGIPQSQLGQQPNGVPFMPVRDQMFRQRQVQQAQQQSQPPQQQQGGGPGGPQMTHQQGMQQGPQPGGVFPTGSANGMGSMAGLGGMGGMGGNMGGAGFQNLPSGASAAGAMAQLGGMRRVPSQAGQSGQPQPHVVGPGNTNMNMGMLSALGVGGVNGMNNVGLGMPTSLSALRQGTGAGGMPAGPQRLTSYPGASQPPGGPGVGPGQMGAPGQQRSVSSMAHGTLPPEVAAAISQQQNQRHREQQQEQAQAHLQHQQQSQAQQQGQGHGQGPQQHLGQQQHGGGLPIQHPRTPSLVNANASQNPPMPTLTGMNGISNPNVGAGPNGAGPGPIPNPMNPNAPNPMGAPGMQRAASAQSMAPGVGGMHAGLPNHQNQNPQQLPHGQQQQPPNPPPFTNPLHHGMQNPQIQHHSQQQHPQLGVPQQHLGGHHGPQGPTGLSGMGGGMGMSMSGMPGAGGGMQGHPVPGAGPGQQHPMNAGSPPRPGTGGPGGPGQTQPQTPSIPVSMRPQSRMAPGAGVNEQQGGPPGMMGFPTGGGQPQFGGQMRHAGPPGGGPGHQQHPGQQGPLGPFGAQGMAGMAGRTTPHSHPAHAHSPMAALGNSPGATGPMNARPGSSNGHPGPGGMSTPNLGGMAGIGLNGRPGPVGGGPGASTGFPTPAQQLAEQQQQLAARNTGMGPFAGSMGPLTGQGMPPPTQGQGPGAQHRPSTSQAHPHGPGHGPQPPPFASPVVHQAPAQQQQQGTNAGSPAAHQQPTPALQQAGGGQGPLGRMGTPTLAQGLTQTGAVNRSPARVRTPSRQMPQTMGTGQAQGQGQGPSRTPRTQAAQLPATLSAGGPSSGPSVPGTAPGLGRAPPMSMLGRQGVGLGIAAPGTGRQPSQPPNVPGGQPQAQQQRSPSTAGSQQRPTTQDGTNPPHSMGMVPMPPMMQRATVIPTQGIARLLAFSESLSRPKLPSSKEFWESLVAEYFLPKAVVKITLWKGNDNAQQEAKPFDITMPILPLFFLVTSQAGVDSMSINYNGAKETHVPIPAHPYATFIECQNAAWTFYYTNGYIVTLRGSFNATLIPVSTGPHPRPPTPAGANGLPPPYVSYTWKIDSIVFNSATHEKALRVKAIQAHSLRTIPKSMSVKAEIGTGNGVTSNSSPGAASTTIGGNSAESTPVMEEGQVGGNTGGEMVIRYESATIPTEPVNAFGIPQATMRCLELAESIGNMSELMEFTVQTGLRPLDALSKFANNLREQGFVYQNPSQGSPGQLMDAHQTNGVVTSPAVTLYQSSPPVEHATTNTGGLHPPPSNVRPGGTANAGGTGPGRGAGDTNSSPNMSSTPASAQTPSAPPLSAAPTSTSSTPMVSHATLKRKAGDTASPSTATAEQVQPPTKRTQRKRSVRH